MVRPFRLTLLAFLPLLAASCTQLSFSSAPELRDVRYYYVDMFSAYDRDMQISPDGQVIIAERKGNRPGDARQVAGRLSEAEIAELASAFKGWKDLKPFYSSDINSVVRISYDGYEVLTSNIMRTPANFNRVHDLLEKIAKATLASAPQPATQPTTTTAPHP